MFATALTNCMSTDKRRGHFVGDHFSMRIQRGLIEFGGQFALKLVTNKVLNLLGRGMQMISWQVKMASHVGFPQSVRPNQALGSLASLVR